MKKLSFTVFWIVQLSALLVFFVPFTWPLVALWAASHFLRAIGLTLAFHRYFAHRAFQMNRTARFVWSFIGTAAMQKGPLWWAGHHVNHHLRGSRCDSHVRGERRTTPTSAVPERQPARSPQATNPVIRDFLKAPEIVWLDELLRAATGARDRVV
jgi:stearoyl-CoA desaturase (delta-9 desaturase)